MGIHSTAIEQTAAQQVPTVAADQGSAIPLLTGPALLLIISKIVGGVAFLETMARGAQILSGTAAPLAAQGLDGDAFFNTVTGDFFLKAAGVWGAPTTLKGAPGYTPRKGIDYFDGRTPVKGTDYSDGKSTYQLWLDAGNVGTLAQYLASIQATPGTPGANGTNGSQIRWESFAPTTEPAAAGDFWIHAINSIKSAFYEHYAPAAGGLAWRLRFTTPDAAVSTAAPAPTSAGVSTFNTRAGAVVLAADDVLPLLMNGTNTTISKDATTGKLRIDATASTSTGTGGHIIKDATGATITQPTIIIRNGLRIVQDAAAATMAFELDPAGAPASEGNQAGIVIDFAKRYQNRTAAAGNITLSDFQSTAVGGKVRIELNSTAAGDLLIIGGYTVSGADANFQSTVKVSGVATSGTNQSCTFYDCGGPFIGGVKNILTIECVGTNRFSFTLDPQV